MGKSTTTPTVQNPWLEGSSQAQTTTVVTPETSKGTRQEMEASFGETFRDTRILTKVTKGPVIEGVVEDCDEDVDDASDPPTKSFLRRRLEEQSRQFEQTLSRNERDTRRSTWPQRHTHEIARGFG